MTCPPHHFDLNLDQFGRCRHCEVTKQFPAAWLPVKNIYRSDPSKSSAPTARKSKYRGVRLTRQGWQAYWSAGRSRQGDGRQDIGDPQKTEDAAARIYNEYAVSKLGRSAKLNVIEEAVCEVG